MRETIVDLKDAIVRHSPMIADNIGFPMTVDELMWLYETIGKHYEIQDEYNKRYSIGALRERFKKIFGIDDE